MKIKATIVPNRIKIAEMIFHTIKNNFLPPTTSIYLLQILKDIECPQIRVMKKRYLQFEYP
ncbi:hypothetical protein (plasmid) [Staphylococcus aureus]|nr:uncharacterized protein JP02758_P0049 [Staphylococcus aureus]